MSEEKYQGLNLPQLFELMHDIVPPEPVPWMPQTPGWWVLLAWIAAVSALTAAGTHAPPSARTSR